MNEPCIIVPVSISTHEDLRLSDLTGAASTCSVSDPGPDPSYDHDPIPADEVAC
jgi:hypothetical protein